MLRNRRSHWQLAHSGPLVPFPKAIELTEQCHSTSPTQPPVGHFTVRAPPSNSKEPILSAHAATPCSPPVHERPTVDDRLGTTSQPQEFTSSHQRAALRASEFVLLMWPK